MDEHFANPPKYDMRRFGLFDPTTLNMVGRFATEEEAWEEKSRLTNIHGTLYTAYLIVCEDTE